MQRRRIESYVVKARNILAFILMALGAGFGMGKLVFVDNKSFEDFKLKSQCSESENKIEHTEIKGDVKSLHKDVKYILHSVRSIERKLK